MKIQLVRFHTWDYADFAIIDPLEHKCLDSRLKPVQKFSKIRMLEDNAVNKGSSPASIDFVLDLKVPLIPIYLR